MESFSEPVAIDMGLEPDVVPGVLACGPARGATGCCWARLEYLLWWQGGQSLPPLVTTSPAGTEQVDAGVLGLDSTSVLLGDGTLGRQARPGGRLTIGMLLDPCGGHAVEGRFFSLGKQTAALDFESSAEGSPILARPFLDGDAQAARLVGYPGFWAPGTVHVQSETEVLGGDALCRWLVGRSGTTSVDLLAGYHFARIDGRLLIEDWSVAVDVPLVDPGTTLQIADDFSARNEFHAGQIGMAIQHERAGWRLELLAKVALGSMHETVTITGRTTTITPPPDSETAQQGYGLLAQGANLGRHARSEFAVSPEVGLRCIWQLSPCALASLGYSYVHWSNVALPAQQIDPQLLVPTRSFAIRDSSYWAHGLNAGFEFRF